jgi:Secretion system C-terminal sorting domain
MRRLLLLSSLLFCLNCDAQVRWYQLMPDTNCWWSNNIFLNDTTVISASIGRDIDYFNLVKGMTKSNGIEIKRGNKFLKRDNDNWYNPFYLYSNFDVGVISNYRSKMYLPFMSSNYPIDSSNLLTYLATINSKDLIVDTFTPFGYPNLTTYVGSLIEVAPNKIALGASVRDRWPQGWKTRMALYFLDSNGTTLFKDTFTNDNDEALQNMLTDRNGNFYLCGAYVPKEFPGDYTGNDMSNVVKKISSGGQLLINRVLPLRNNVQYPFITSIGDVLQDKFLLINAADRYYKSPSSGSDGPNWLRFLQLDTNLNTLKIDSLKRGYFFNLQGVKTLKNSDILLWGGRTLDTVWNNINYEFALYGWAMRLDSTGKIKWDRMYNFRDSADHYLNDMKEDADGSLYFAGAVLNFKNALVRFPQQSMLMRVDSNGCINNNCYPMGMQEVKVIDDNVLLVYPNPTNSRITLRLADLDLLGGSITITSFNGARLFDGKALLAETSLDISGWAKGIYVLSYRKDDWRKNVQFVVE